MEENTIVLGAGQVQYSIEDARVEIGELISALQEAQEEGAEYVVMSSGNYRGAKWQSISAAYSFAESD